MGEVVKAVTKPFAALAKGSQIRKRKYAEEKALREAANRRMATATADMSEDQRLKERMESRALAVAAATGGGIDDPTIVNLIGDLNAEGEYRSLARLWVGQDEAEGLRYQAEAARKEGAAAMNSAYVEAVTSVLTSEPAGDMWSKYSQKRQTAKALAAKEAERIKTIHQSLPT